MSRCVWALAPEEITEHLERTVEPDAKNWIFHLIETLNHKDLVRCFVTLWAIWFARRKVIHENIFQSPLSTHCFIESFLRDLEMAAPARPVQQQRSSAAPAPRWIAPPVGYAKINVDAVVQKLRNAGAVAAVCRRDDGSFLGASAVSISGITEPGILEALACREALSLAADLQLQHICIASDCLEVIKGLFGSSPLRKVWSHTRSLL